MEEEECKQALERKNDEMTLLSAEKKLTNYESKWAVKTIPLTLSPRTEGLSSTVEDTNDQRS